jgi:hypothetical protein
LAGLFLVVVVIRFALDIAVELGHEVDADFPDSRRPNTSRGADPQYGWHLGALLSSALLRGRLLAAALLNPMVSEYYLIPAAVEIPVFCQLALSPANRRGGGRHGRGAVRRPTE